MNLVNRTILITRPAPAGPVLCSLIEAQGAHAIHFPTIQFAPPPDQEALNQSIAMLDQHHWLIFISPQAVYAASPLIRKAWPVLPAHVKIAAVGAGTAQALAQAGYTVACYPTQEWSSEGLLDLPEFRSLTGKKIAIIRGAGGRELLANTLVERGAAVTHMIAYQRVLPDRVKNLPWHDSNQKTIHAIVCTSFEAVQNLKKLFAEEAWSTIQQTPLIVVSERIKMLAHNLDFQTIWVARNASHEAILEALEGLNYAG